MSKRRSWKRGALAGVYAALMALGVTAPQEAAAHSCAQVSHGTTVGTCEEHDEDTHLCDTTGNGTEVVVCIDTTP